MRNLVKTLIAGAVFAGLSANVFAADGKAVYEASCKMCHATGVMGAPKLGDKAAWTARIAGGIAHLEKNAINGFTGKTGSMPPKGGNAKLSDADVKQAVAYMVNAAK
jgi:cytochrome c5